MKTPQIIYQSIECLCIAAVIMFIVHSCTRVEVSNNLRNSQSTVVTNVTVVVTNCVHESTWKDGFSHVPYVNPLLPAESYRYLTNVILPHIVLTNAWITNLEVIH